MCSLPSGAKAFGVKWIYKTKLNKNGEIDQCKGRFVIKGFAQQYDVDYTEAYASVARWDTIRSIFALAARRGMKIYQMDVKSAFLHVELTETVYVEQPLGSEKEGNKN